MRALVLLLILLAGCGAPDPGPSPTAQPTPTVSTTPPEPQTQFPLLADFSFTDCQGTRAVVHPPLEEVQSALPSNFTATEHVGPAGPTGQGTVTYEVLHCGAYESPTTTTNATVVGKIFADIEVPQLEIQLQSAQYLFRMLGGEDTFPNLWRVAGYDTHNGTWNLSRQDAGPLQQAAFDVGDYSIIARTAAEETGTATFGHVTQLADGSHLVWTGTIAETRQAGIGDVVVAEDDPFTDNQGDGFIVQGDWTEMDLVRLF